MKIGAIYSTFYDLDMMEKSIASIRGVVDYIVVVHQRIGFNGNLENDDNEKYLNGMDVEKIIFYEFERGKDKRDGMLEKQNLGLQELKDVGCDYYVLMSADIIIDSNGLMDDIKFMQDNNLDTCYYPIKAYYYDENHYFIDSYYTAQIYKINDRQFGLNTSSVLCDPLTKMEERKYFISKNYVHHYTFLKDHYGKKLNNSIRTIGNHAIACDMELIYDRLMNWKEGETALVFTNDMSRNGKVVLAEIELEKKKTLYKLAICIPFYKRENITRYVFNYYQELKHRLRDKVELVLISCGSEGAKSMKLATSYGFHYIEYPNDYLSEKRNALVMFARIYNVDACIKIDSDSIIDEPIFDWYIDLLDKGVEYAGIRGIWFLFKDAFAYKKAMCGKRELEPHGVGRFMSKGLLDKMNWKPFETKRKRGLDKLLTMSLIKYHPKQEIRDLCEFNCHIIDLKSEMQITDISGIIYDSVIDVPLKYSNISKSLIKFDGSILKDVYTVIIPTMWVNGKILSEMVESYLKSPYIKEIIIIDNNPKDRIKIKDSKVRILSKDENIYVNPAWNWGVKEATTEKIIIANDDILIKDFDALMGEIQISLMRGSIIAPSEECFSLKKSKNIEIVKAKERNLGFGTFMVMYKDDYTFIPDRFKIWVGDNIQFHTKKAFNITGLSIETKMSSTIKKYGLRNKGVAEHEYYEKFCNLDGSIKDENAQGGITIGLVYSGRIKNFFGKWMDSLIDDINILSNKPELIIVNNSNEKLNTSLYDKYFYGISVLQGAGNVSRGLENYRTAKANMLSESYNLILNNSSYNLIHLREDDIIPEADSFKKLYNYINKCDKNTVVCGLYFNRKLDCCSNNDTVSLYNKPIQIEKTGTGFIMFWKDKHTTFPISKNLKTHDWAWCTNLKDNNKNIIMLPDALCNHYIDYDVYAKLPIHKISEDNYTNIIIPKYTYTKITGQKNRGIKRHLRLKKKLR